MFTYLLQNKNRWLSKVSLYFLLTLIATLFYTNLKAAEGCYVSGIIYDQAAPPSGNYFLQTPNSLATCGYTGTLSGNCYVYKGTGDITKKPNYTRYNGSYSSNISVIPCPFDDKIWLMLLTVALGIALKFRLIKA